MKWTYNGGPFPDPKRIKEETIIGMTCMTLIKAKRKDGGKYVVTLENEYGSGKYTTHINVLGKALLFFISFTYFNLLMIFLIIYKLSKVKCSSKGAYYYF